MFLCNSFSTLLLPNWHSIGTKVVFCGNYCIERNMHDAKILERILRFAYE